MRSDVCPHVCGPGRVRRVAYIRLTWPEAPKDRALAPCRCRMHARVCVYVRIARVREAYKRPACHGDIVESVQSRACMYLYARCILHIRFPATSSNSPLVRGTDRPRGERALITPRDAHVYTRVAACPTCKVTGTLTSPVLSARTGPHAPVRAMRRHVSRCK